MTNNKIISANLLPTPYVVVLPFCSTTFTIKDKNYCKVLREVIKNNKPLVMTKSEQSGNDVIPEKIGVLCHVSTISDSEEEMRIQVTGLCNAEILSAENEGETITVEVNIEIDFSEQENTFNTEDSIFLNDLKGKLLDLYGEDVEGVEDDVLDDYRMVINNAASFLFKQIDKQYFLELEDWDKKLQILQLLDKGCTMDVVLNFVGDDSERFKQ